ncbi:hypothetical protein LBUL87_1340 [Lactobacillus delbrueckii subsp. bulgaricus]|nr:hypothetical protein AT236_01490 [Lactobacillus delbrueckii subsp. bulgaricus]SNR19920.1 hypothetical protein LBUL87_1340 [Lactobacillus delbrueckii subsp. bulgaricus]
MAPGSLELEAVRASKEIPKKGEFFHELCLQELYSWKNMLY